MKGFFNCHSSKYLLSGADSGMDTISKKQVERTLERTNRKEVTLSSPESNFLQDAFFDDRESLGEIIEISFTTLP